nr:hypothetical protein [uncultured Methanolobus sp.]
MEFLTKTPINNISIDKIVGVMKTYLVLWFNSNGALPSEIDRSLMSLGFKAVQGNFDYVYDWGNNVDLDDILRFTDKIQMTLKGTGAMFKTETVNGQNK